MPPGAVCGKMRRWQIAIRRRRTDLRREPPTCENSTGHGTYTPSGNALNPTRSRVVRRESSVSRVQRFTEGEQSGHEQEAEYHRSKPPLVQRGEETIAHEPADDQPG
jgi:hypothetical protein